MRSAPLEKTARGASKDGLLECAALPLRRFGNHRIERIADVDRLALFDPDFFAQLLRSYWMVLGESRLWWEIHPADDAGRWHKAVRDAIVEVANAGSVQPEWLADALDRELPNTRRRVVAIARQRYSEVAN